MKDEIKTDAKPGTFDYGFDMAAKKAEEEPTDAEDQPDEEEVEDEEVVEEEDGETEEEDGDSVEPVGDADGGDGGLRPGSAESDPGEDAEEDEEEKGDDAPPWFQSYVKAQNEKITSLQYELRKLREGEAEDEAKPEAKPKPPAMSDKVRAALEQYEEVDEEAGKAIKEAFSELYSQVQSVQLHTAAQQAEKEHQAEWAKVLDKHPDAREVDQNPVFKQFLHKLPEAIKPLAKSNKSDDVIFLLDQFKQAHPTDAPKNVKREARRKLSTHVKTKRTPSTRKRSSSNLTGFDKGWARAAKEIRDRRARRGKTMI